MIGIGGSSSVDATVLTASNQELASMYGIGNVRGSRLPVVQSPTTDGIAAADIERLAEDTWLQTRLLRNNPRELPHTDARMIYAATLMASLTARLSLRFLFAAAVRLGLIDQQETNRKIQEAVYFKR